MSAEQTPDIEVVHSVLAESVGIYDLTDAEAAAFARLYHERALAPVLAAAVREAKVEVLREVADDQEFWLLDAMDGERLYVDCGHLGHPSGVVGISEARPTDLSRWVAQHLADRADRVAEPQHEAERRTFTVDEVIEIANETSDSLGNLYRLDFIDRIEHEAATSGKESEASDE